MKTLIHISINSTKILITLEFLAGRLSGNAFVSRAGVLRFKSLAGQIDRNISDSFIVTAATILQKTVLSAAILQKTVLSATNLQKKRWVYAVSVFYPLLSDFIRFFFSMKKVCFVWSAFLYVYIGINQIVTCWTKVFRKKILLRECSHVLKYRSYRSYTKFLTKLFITILTVSADMDV